MSKEAAIELSQIVGSLILVFILVISVYMYASTTVEYRIITDFSNTCLTSGSVEIKLNGEEYTFSCVLKEK